MAVASDGSRYSGVVGLIYVFNLVVGFGALTLPDVFYKSGYVLATLFLMLLAFVSYITATFVVECMAIGNAMMFLDLEGVKKGKSRLSMDARGQDAVSAQADRLEEEGGELEDERNMLLGRSDRQNQTVNRRVSTASNGGSSGQQTKSDASARVTDQTSPVDKDPFELRRQLELSDLARLFLGPKGSKLLAAITAVYLYGDLAIYATATPTTLVNVYPGDMKEVSLPFFADPVQVDETLAYNVWLFIFACIVVPLSCLNFSKTKHLQIFTCTYRNFALFAMIMMAIRRYQHHEEALKAAEADPSNTLLEEETILHPPVAVFGRLPKLFGAATYSFMCHHSIPGLVCPIHDKPRRSIMKILAIDYGLITIFYLALCLTAMLAFGTWQSPSCITNHHDLTCSIQKIYILNFATPEHPLFGEVLTMLPVFICLTNFPLIAITTRNNLIPWFETGKRVLFGMLGLEETPEYIPIGKNASADGRSSSNSALKSSSAAAAAAAAVGGRKSSTKRTSSNDGIELIETLSENSSSGNENRSTSPAPSSNGSSKKPAASSPGAVSPKVWHSLLVSIPPIIIAYLIQDVGVVVEFTGSYAGLTLEFLFPCWLVLSARKRLALVIDQSSLGANPFGSPFQGRAWVRCVLLWAFISLFFIISQQVSERRYHPDVVTPIADANITLAIHSAGNMTDTFRNITESLNSTLPPRLLAFIYTLD